MEGKAAVTNVESDLSNFSVSDVQSNPSLVTLSSFSMDSTSELSRTDSTPRSPIVFTASETVNEVTSTITSVPSSSSVMTAAATPPTKRVFTFTGSSSSTDFEVPSPTSTVMTSAPSWTDTPATLEVTSMIPVSADLSETTTHTSSGPTQSSTLTPVSRVVEGVSVTNSAAELTSAEWEPSITVPPSSVKVTVPTPTTEVPLTHNPRRGILPTTTWGSIKEIDYSRKSSVMNKQKFVVVTIIVAIFALTVILTYVLTMTRHEMK